jgi:hypothetical protein
MDFIDQLKRQLNFIITSCRAYDDGMLEEASRIAVVGRVLFYLTKNYHTLLRQNIK